MRQILSHGRGQGIDKPGLVGNHCNMTRTIFCVQPYVRSAGLLRKGQLRRLLSRDAAIRAAKAEKGHAAGVVVFRVTGTPEADYWSEPVVIARAGDVPGPDQWGEVA